jgi:para-aminobenzoate synthetase component 1
LNAWGADRIPFVFFTDFEGQRTQIATLADAASAGIHFDFHGVTNTPIAEKVVQIDLQKQPISKEVFALAFEQVVAEINYGNSFLTNLTFETPVTPTADLETIITQTSAKYKLRFQDQFVCFSPEIFVQICDGKIRSFPMKGTIDATLPHARETILNDPKELAEHITIVDLIRNDLSTVAKDVTVERFRYIDEIRTDTGTILQVSSEIVGQVEPEWQAHLGDILFALLPAGSICGAPKPKTVNIIRQVETHNRGFYTGVCGLFDGQKLDSGVMIRFIEKRGELFYYKSGGGITAQSEVDKEYEEYIRKIYVPVS